MELSKEIKHILRVWEILETIMLIQNAGEF